jgi:uncharacterized protein (TIGR00369 family)
MADKRVSDSSLVTAIQMQPQDANPFGNVHGGVIMKNVDTTAGIVGLRHTGANVVTASLDRLDFLEPVFVGDVLVLSASINLVGRTSLEIGVRVEAEDPRSGRRRHTASAYLTFVCLDSQGKPRQIPGLILETEEERRRHREAVERRRVRLAEKQREQSSQQKG